jgi:glycosyltransferase involved in cell wall biosynthesis
MKTPNDCSDKYNLLDDHRLAQAEIDLPFVTVIVTNYNYENYVVPCLRSIARQKYPHFKCIVVDDVSTDHSVERIDNFIKSDESKGKFELICHENNGGQMTAFKSGLKHAEGVFVVFLDSDDIILEDFLITHVQAHLRAKTVAFTSSNQYQINENNEIVSGIYDDLQVKDDYKYINPISLIKQSWVWATTSSMMFRRSALELIMPDDCEHLRICADNYICHFANLLGGSLLIPTVHGCYRRHGLNYFASNPVVSGQLLIGDMRKHPSHNSIRTSILNHLLRHQEKFLPMMPGDRFTFILSLIAKPLEIFKLRKEYPECFSDRSIFFYLKLLIMGSISKAKYFSDKLRRLFMTLIKK